MIDRRHMFRRDGRAAESKIKLINLRLKTIRDQMAAQFPLNAAQVVAFRENLARHVLAIHNIEKEAIGMLQNAMK
jgi:hypothetical protein